jgi:hypothetical protein
VERGEHYVPGLQEVNAYTPTHPQTQAHRGGVYASRQVLGGNLVLGKIPYRYCSTGIAPFSGSTRSRDSVGVVFEWNFCI